jgi:hypothetical protein
VIPMGVSRERLRPASAKVLRGWWYPPNQPFGRSAATGPISGPRIAAVAKSQDKSGINSRPTGK